MFNHKKRYTRTKKEGKGRNYNRGREREKGEIFRGDPRRGIGLFCTPEKGKRTFSASGRSEIVKGKTKWFNIWKLPQRGGRD